MAGCEARRKERDILVAWLATTGEFLCRKALGQLQGQASGIHQTPEAGILCWLVHWEGLQLRELYRGI